MSYKITDTIIVDNNKNIGSIGTALFAGPVIIGGGNSTGTVSQPLQVTGTNGAYIGGNLGIGSTNPTSKLWVSGDIYNTGIHTAQVLNASKDPGTGIATDFTNSLFGNGWRVSSPGSTTYYKLATLPPGGGGSTFDHLIINGVLGAWTNGNQTPFEITFSNRGSFNYKYVSYGSVRSDVRIIGISTNSSVEIWAQHQASQFTKLVYNIPNSIESIVVSNPTSTTTAPTGTTVFDSSTVTPRFIINESDNVGIGTATPTSKLDIVGDGRFTGVVTASQLDLTASATANDSVLYLSGAPTGSSGTNGLFGIGALSFSDTDIIADFTHSVNSYAQLVVQNKNSGSSSSADIIVNNDRSAGTTYYGDFGINGTTFAGGGAFGDVDGTYLYSAGGTLSVGSLGAYDLKFATNNNVRITVNSSGNATFTGQHISTGANSTTTGGGQIYLNGATGNRIDFNANGAAAPSFTPRSVGTKIVLYPGVDASNVDYAFGIEGNTLWSSVPASGHQFKWYAGTTNIATLFGTGQLVLGTTSLTGTASQLLQVTGGAYVSDSVGIGTTAPLQKLHVLGNLLVAAGSSTGQHITQKAYELNSGTLSWEGSAGQLFSITNNLTSGSIFSVNDVSGIPSIDVNADGTVTIATYGGNVGVGTTNPTSKLHVVGDVLVSGVVTATSFSGSGAFLTNITPSSNLTGISTLGFFSDEQNITSNITLPSNTQLYTVHKNINVVTGSTITIGSGSTIIMDRLNNLDNVVAISFKGDGSQLTGIPVGDLYELDQISPAGGENTYTPTFNYDTVAVSDPFRLLISVNGIMQSAYVHNTEYVFNNSLLASRTGYTIDYDGKIKFTEALPEGSEVMIKTTAGTTKSTTRKYPFNALDILF